MAPIRQELLDSITRADRYDRSPAELRPLRLEAARELFKERTTRLATDAERSKLLQAVETAATLRRVDALMLLHHTLRIWIAPHVISTSLMLALMLVHIIQVIFFAVK